MALLTFVRLLFVLALLTQVAAGAFASPQSGGARLCGFTHSEARVPTVVDASEQAPQRETGHRHGACVLCLFGSGDAPLHARILAVDPLAVASGARLSFVYAEGLVRFFVDRNASARAPPSLS
ncbi:MULTISPECIES: DUF2946 family protein [Methylosinus]|uniref:DUF2946 domain-containing protein n=1 Tax=Methylosinus trichosporium (strain ATCC 35070 / NCIMB 11131 / UNIQEM 75 / OB3b) TaxID=595536 RepID=A0A2D2D425_METT3|nr:MULTISPECIES: hypothetical protein [Methylosinus]ATQ69742.1 hypothetical protein CQW49_19015 [Methylosinus trichosporium OB3b]OBS52459.1 hypothetical protein A8B73_11445 [Methylosinus sp. 3S-1]